jgi:hypothetical protein
MAGRPLSITQLVAKREAELRRGAEQTHHRETEKPLWITGVALAIYPRLADPAGECLSGQFSTPDRV